MKMRVIMNTHNASIVEKAKACWQNFCDYWREYPPPVRMLNIAMVPSASGRLLPVMVMMIEARELVNDQETATLYPGDSACNVFIYTKYSAMKTLCSGAFTGRDGFAQRRKPISISRVIQNIPYGHYI